MSITDSSSHDPRWRRLPEERPQQILDAALSVFAEHGIDAAKLEEIAARAGVSKGTIYLYFPSKEELFREVVRQRVGPAIANADSASTTEGSAEEQFRSYLSAPVGMPRPEGFRGMDPARDTRIPQVSRISRRSTGTRSSRARTRSWATSSAAASRAASSADRSQAAVQMIKALILMHVLWTGPRAPAPVQHRPALENVLANVTDFVLHALRATPRPAAPDSGAPHA